MLASSVIRRTVQRPVFRQQQRRLQSTSSEQAQKKAQDTLASAQATAENVWKQVVKIMGPVGETAGRLLGGYKEPLLYNFAVARELAKQIYVAERLAPPSIDAFRAAYASLWAQISSPAAVRQFAGSGDRKSVV